MKTINIWALCMVIAVISCLGFIVENIWLAAAKGYMDNRNMFFPFLIGYGIAILLIYIILGTPQNLWLFGNTSRIKSRRIKLLVYFAGSMICVSAGEILLGKIVEYSCHFYWWDYSALPLHITRYTSIPTSMMFACLITFLMDKVFFPLYYYFRRWDQNILCITATLLMIIMTGDFIYNAYIMHKTKKMIKRWTIDTTGSWIYKKVRGRYDRLRSC